MDKITLDYNSPGMPVAVALFRPEVFKGLTGYCCLLGPNTDIGIYGCGSTPSEAITDWDYQFNELLDRETVDQGIIRYIRDRLAEVRKKQSQS